MSYKIPFPETSITRLMSDDPQAQLTEVLRELLLHHSAIGLYPEAQSLQDLPSIYLLKSEYVSGEKSVRKSYMRLNLRVSPEDVEHPAAETFTLLLSVERQKPC